MNCTWQYLSTAVSSNSPQILGLAMKLNEMRAGKTLVPVQSLQLWSETRELQDARPLER